MAGQERTPRAEQNRREMYTPPSSEGRREVRRATPEQQERSAERLRAKEQVAESLRQSAFEKAPALMKYLDASDQDRVLDLVQQFENLSADKANQGVSAEDYATKKRNIFTEMNVVFDKALDKIQSEEEAAQAETDQPAPERQAAPSKREMYRPADAEEEDASREDEDTNFEHDMSAVNAQRAEQAAAAEANPDEEETERTDTQELAQQESVDQAAWDSYAGQMIDWAVKNNLYDMNTDRPENVWRGDLSNEQLLKLTGLDQGQLFQLTTAMIRRKKRSIQGRAGQAA